MSSVASTWSPSNVHSDSYLYLFLALLAIALCHISLIDRREFRIPDWYTKPTLGFLTLLMLVTPSRYGTLFVSWSWLIAMYVVTFFMPQILGRGDVKFIAALVLINDYYGRLSALDFLALLLFISSLVALPGAYRARIRGLKYPFAPAISGAALVLIGIGII